MTDLISRADAMEAVRWETSKLGRGLLGKGDILDIIEALPSAEQHNKDAISREGLLRSWEELSPRGRTEFDQVIMTIPALPSADAVQGEWIDIDNYYRMATCSRCHKVTMFEKWGEYTKPYDFCPNCGARMEGGDDE